MRRAARWLLAAALAVIAAAQLPAAAAARPPDAWSPALRTARAFALQRQGAVTFAVAVDGRRWGHRAGRTHASASLVKAMLMVAYLREPGVRSRALRADERGLLGPMIRFSDNAAASQVRNRLGFDAMPRLARAARMRHFGWTGDWGAARLSAADQAGFFLRLERLLPRRHRAAGLGWLRSVDPRPAVGSRPRRPAWLADRLQGRLAQRRQPPGRAPHPRQRAGRAGGADHRQPRPGVRAGDAARRRSAAGEGARAQRPRARPADRPGTRRPSRRRPRGGPSRPPGPRADGRRAPPPPARRVRRSSLRRPLRGSSRAGSAARPALSLAEVSSARMAVMSTLRSGTSTRGAETVGIR